MTKQEALDRIELAIYDYLSLVAPHAPGFQRVDWSQRLTDCLSGTIKDTVRDWYPTQLDAVMKESE